MTRDIASTVNDIANFTSGRAIRDETKYELIQNRAPHPQFRFPSQEFKDNRKGTGVSRRYCQHDWFHTYQFISYSTKEDGLYCLACALFPTKPKHGARCKLLISKPYRNWKDARADLSAHSTLEYHVDSMILLEGFSATMVNPKKRIDLTLADKCNMQIEENRQFLISVIKSIELYMWPTRVGTEGPQR